MLSSRTLAAVLAACLTPQVARAQRAPAVDAATGAQVFKLPDGGTATIGKDGLGWRSDKTGRRGHPFAALRQSVKTGMGETSATGDFEMQRRLAVPQRGRFVPGRVIIHLEGATVLDGGKPGAAASVRGPRTSEPRLDEGLRAAGARTMQPVANAAGTYVVDVAGEDPVRAAARLRGLPGVVHAAPDFYVSSMATEPRALPQTFQRAAAQATVQGRPTSGVPANFGLQTSLQSYLNANGVDAVGAFAEIARRFGQLPGEGTIVTNVSIGDLTDPSQAGEPDGYVAYYGATTRVVGGQRYLDFVSLPLIPTFTVARDGTVDPLGTVKFVDPVLGEVLLDFSVMAPLPHDRQRPEATGSGATDLLGIAPGAQYRLVVPQEPTISSIYVAMLAAAKQVPRPDVISASLGFGFDSSGFPGRYLEDDPIGQSVISTIVHDYGIVVAISSNDGTRLYTNAAVGPDGGSAATDLVPRGGTPTSVADDALSTIPTLVVDSGAFAVGGTTLDDIFSAPPHGAGPLARNGQFPTTRLNGGGGFSSGFGSRVNISAPSDNIVSLIHSCQDFGCRDFDAIPVLSGGTSASAPMVAAASAVVIQVSRLMHRKVSPAQVRDLLVRTARPIPDAPQSGRHLNVGPQLDLAAAVRSLLGEDDRPARIVRTSVAHRQPLGQLGASFVTATDPANIDLLGPDDFSGGLGQNVVGPITFGLDVTGSADEETRYALRIGRFELVSAQPSFRLLPEEILAAAGLPLAANDSRSVRVTLEVRDGRRVADAATTTLTFSASDGTYSEALAPLAPGSIDEPRDVIVHYDLRGVRQVGQMALVVSSIDHFSPILAPFYRDETVIPLSRVTGSVRVPATAFAAGNGLYGLAVVHDVDAGLVSEYAVLRVGAAGLSRPAAPVLADSTGVFGHGLAVSRAAPRFTVRWDARAVQGADGAILEVSAPGPTLFNSLNTFTNPNGDRRDRNGHDAGSTLWRPLGSVAGRSELDPLALGLPTSLFYNFRIFATRHGRIVGEASPSSALELDDGLAPGAFGVTNFDVAGDGPTVTLAAFDRIGALLESVVAPYSPKTGSFGAPFAQDASGQGFYSILGSDPALRATAVVRYPWRDGPQAVEVYDSIGGGRRSSVIIDPLTEAWVINGRVDAARHRAAVLTWKADDFSDILLSFDLGSGAVTSSIPADAQIESGPLFTALEIDSSTGRVILGAELFGDLCIGGRFGGWLTSVDLDRGSVHDVVKSRASCITGFASDQAGGNVWLTLGPLFSFPRLLPPGRTLPVDETSFDLSAEQQDLGARSPLFPVYDAEHHLLVVAFVAGSNFYENNNAMSAIGAYDTRTGERVSYSETFNLASEAFSNAISYIGERGIQLDPRTRTGWTFGPYAAQIQQFRY